MVMVPGSGRPTDRELSIKANPFSRIVTSDKTPPTV